MAQDPNDRTLVERVDPLVGSILDRRYRIDFRLAAGGFGAIYRATHVKSKHEVALKVLHPRLATDPGVVARFRREGATLTTLRSPHTITAYELGEAEDGTLYIVMELLAGESLFERYRARGRFEWRRMAAIARAVCSSLAEAHALGIVHRDLKPTNIHLEERDGDPDFVKVLDFGIAKILHDSAFDSSDLTSAGQMIGTLDYMAPEQMVGGACTGQSDIYVLGIVIYEMIAGCRPFEDTNSPAAALAAMLKTTPKPLSQRIPVPPELDAIVMRCLAREAKDRYPDVTALGAELGRLLDGIDGSDANEVTQTLTLPTDSDVTRAVVLDPDAGLDSQDQTLFSTLPAPRVAPRPRPAAFTPAAQVAAPPPIDDGRGSQPHPLPSTHGGRASQPRLFPPTHGARPPLTPSTPLAYPPTPTPPPPYGQAPGSGAPMPYSPAPPTPRGYDMAGGAARDAQMRRMVWIVVLVGGALLGVIVASQL